MYLSVLFAPRHVGAGLSMPVLQIMDLWGSRLPLEGKVGCVATRMRCRRLCLRLKSIITLLRSYTSPPPLAEPLLKEKP